MYACTRSRFFRGFIIRGFIIHGWVDERDGRFASPNTLIMYKSVSLEMLKGQNNIASARETNRITSAGDCD